MEVWEGTRFTLDTCSCYNNRTLRFLCLNERKVSLVAICAVIQPCKGSAAKLPQHDDALGSPEGGHVVFCM